VGSLWSEALLLFAVNFAPLHAPSASAWQRLQLHHLIFLADGLADGGTEECRELDTEMSLSLSAQTDALLR